MDDPNATTTAEGTSGADEPGGNGEMSKRELIRYWSLKGLPDWVDPSTILTVDEFQHDKGVDECWGYDQYDDGLIDVKPGHFIAIVNKKVYGTGGDLQALIAQAAETAGVIPERVAIVHIWAPEDLMR